MILRQSYVGSCFPPSRGQDSGDADADADGPSIDQSVILYDATEEDLMKSIEREFS